VSEPVYMTLFSLANRISWNQVTLQKSTEKIPEQITPTLDKLYDEFRTFGALLNAKIEKLQSALPTQSDHDQDEHELKYMNNLRECVRSAAEVASTASTTLNADTSDRISVKYGSDFGDVFAKDSNEPMLRWMSSNTVYEFEDMDTRFPDPSEASTGEAPTEYQSDSDSDIENEMIRSLFNEGKKRKEQNDVMGAIRHFRNCLTRFSSNASYASLTSLQSVSTCGVSKTELLEQIVDSYCLLGSWSKAKSAMVEKLSITERQVGRKDELYLWDTMKLADIMVKNKEHVEAHLQGRKSLRGFKKLGETGYEGYERCLVFLIQLCSDEGKDDEEEAYAALLGSHERKARRSKAASEPKAARQLETTPQHTTAIDIPLQHNAGANTDGLQDINEPVKTSKEVVVVEASPSGPRSPHLGLQEELNAANLRAPLVTESSGEDRQSDVVEKEEGLSIVAGPRKPPALSPLTTVGKTTKLAQEHATGQEQQMPDPPRETFTAPCTTAGHNVPGFYIARGEEMARKYTRSRRRDIEFFERYCYLFQGCSPYYKLTPSGLRNYDCMVKINKIQGCTVFGYPTKQQAKEAAVAQACEMYISAADEERVLDKAKCRDPSSDKEVWYPEIDRLEYKEVVPEADLTASHVLPSPGRSSLTSPVPHITVSSDETEVATEAPSLLFQLPVRDLTHSTVRRSASASDIDRSRTPGRGFADIWKAQSEAEPTRNTALGRGFARNMLRLADSGDVASEGAKTHRRGAASFSGTSSDVLAPEWEHGDDQRFDGRRSCPYCAEDISSLSQDMVDRHLRRSCQMAWAETGRSGSKEAHMCPVCYTSLSGLSEETASVHVNGCLDATLTSHNQDDTLQDNATDLSPTGSLSSLHGFTVEGTWACSNCKSDTLQSTNDVCHSCYRKRDRHSLRSVNDFRRQHLERYRTLLPSLNLDVSMSREGPIMRRKILLLGDTLCGKTYLASAWSHNATPIGETPLVNSFIKTTIVEGRQVELVIWDNTGLEGYERLRRFSYEDVHVALLCFDISDPDSFDNVEELVSYDLRQFLKLLQLTLAVEQRSRQLATRRTEDSCRVQR
jgi:hypothetical protein